MCYATKTTAGDRRADAENENITDGCCFSAFQRLRGRNPPPETVKKKKFFNQERLGDYCDRNIVVRRNASITAVFEQHGIVNLLHVYRKRLFKIVAAYDIVSPALLLDDRLRVNDWLAAVEYAK